MFIYVIYVYLQFSCIEDILEAAYKAVFEKDEDVKKELQQKFQDNILPEKLGYMERRMEKRGGQFLATNSLSWADIHLFQVQLGTIDQVQLQVGTIDQVQVQLGTNDQVELRTIDQVQLQVGTIDQVQVQ